MKKDMVIFGVTNMLSDIFECAQAVNKKITKIVTNVAEQKRERTKDTDTRLQELGEQPLVVPLSRFVPRPDEKYFVAPTTPRKRALVEYLKEMYQLTFTQLIHPTAFVSRYAKIGQGVFIGAGSVIGAGCVLKDHVFVNTRVTVGHDSVVHEYVRLNPGSNVAGHVEIGEGATVGLGANIIEELVIGAGAIVAAGAVVVNDVTNKTMVAGIPAVTKKLLERPALKSFFFD